uniref:ZAD domain-containing protein n=1 Tax=Anopheles epiroticus TaxID=199890 RepID=A0A182PWC2_9DIPT
MFNTLNEMNASVTKYYNYCDDNIIDWNEEAEAVIRDIREHVKEVSHSEVLPVTRTEAYINVTTLHGRQMCVKLNAEGLQIVAYTHDTQEPECASNPRYETPYALLSECGTTHHHLEPSAVRCYLRYLLVQSIDHLSVTLLKQSIRFIQYEKSATVQKHVTASDQILKTPGCGHDYVYSTLEHFHLFSHVHTSDQQQFANFRIFQMFLEFPYLIKRLLSQLSRRFDDNRLWGVRFRFCGLAFSAARWASNRQTKRAGFAASGFSCHQHITSAQNQRYRFGLHVDSDCLPVFLSDGNINERLQKGIEIIASKVDENDGLPNNICRMCVQSIEDFVDFEANCNRSYEILMKVISGCEYALDESKQSNVEMLTEDEETPHYIDNEDEDVSNSFAEENPNTDYIELAVDDGCHVETLQELTNVCEESNTHAVEESQEKNRVIETENQVHDTSIEQSAIPYMTEEMCDKASNATVVDYCYRNNRKIPIVQWKQLLIRATTMFGIAPLAGLGGPAAAAIRDFAYALALFSRCSFVMTMSIIESTPYAPIRSRFLVTFFASNAAVMSGFGYLPALFMSVIKNTPLNCCGAGGWGMCGSRSKE